MKKRYFIFIIAGLLLAMTTLGCDNALNKNWGPIIERAPSWGVLCGGDWQPAGGVWTGVPAAITFYFNTGNVNQNFEFQLVISSPTISREQTPEIIRYQVGNAKVDPGKASGTKSVSFLLDPKCKGQGFYVYEFMVTDSSGRSATYQGTFNQVDTYLFGEDPCKCKTQCGWCKTDLTDLWTRCTCGCPNIGEKCTEV